MGRLVGKKEVFKIVRKDSPMMERRTVTSYSRKCRRNELGCTDGKADGFDDDRTKDG